MSKRYEYRNGLRYLKESESEGYHFHGDISAKIGTNLPRSLKLHVHGRHSAGIFIPFNTQMKKIDTVKLNNQKLQHKLDYVINDNNSGIAFTFNLISSDKIEVEGIV